jgi:hypothetical protein
VDARQRHLAARQRLLRPSDQDGQVLDPAIGGAEGDDPGLRRVLQRDLRLGDAGQGAAAVSG